MRLEKATSLLSLARCLASSAEGYSIDDISAEFSVDRRTAERMRDAVRDLFPQMEEIRDGRHKRFRIRGALDTFFEVPTAEELADLQLAAKHAAQEGLVGRAESLRRLAGKVEGRIKPSLRVRYAADIEALALAEQIALSPGPRPACPPATLRVLRSALLAMKQVRFFYQSAGDREPIDRTVDHYGLLFGAVYFLVGRRVGTPEPVLWRLDRITEPQLLDSPSVVAEDFELEAFAARSFGVFQEPVEDIVLRVSPAAASRACAYLFHPSQKLEASPDGSLMIQLRAGGLLELCWHLFTWRGEIEIIAPQRLSDLMSAELARFSSQTPP